MAGTRSGTLGMLDRPERIVPRCMGAPRRETCGRCTVPGEPPVRLAPRRAVAEAGVAG